MNRARNFYESCRECQQGDYKLTSGLPLLFGPPALLDLSPSSDLILVTSIQNVFQSGSGDAGCILQQAFVLRHRPIQKKSFNSKKIHRKVRNLSLVQIKRQRTSSY